jgi:hypothetical protein
MYHTTPPTRKSQRFKYFTQTKFFSGIYNVSFQSKQDDEVLSTRTKRVFWKISIAWIERTKMHGF